MTQHQISFKEGLVLGLVLGIMVTLAQVARRGGRCPIPGNIEGQVGRGSEQPARVEDVPLTAGGLG